MIRVKRLKTFILTISIFIFSFFLFFFFIIHTKHLSIIILSKRSVNEDNIFFESIKKKYDLNSSLDELINISCFVNQLKEKGEYDIYKRDLKRRLKGFGLKYDLTKNNTNFNNEEYFKWICSSLRFYYDRKGDVYVFNKYTYKNQFYLDEIWKNNGNNKWCLFAMSEKPKMELFEDYLCVEKKSLILFCKSSDIYIDRYKIHTKKKICGCKLSTLF